MTRDTIKQYRAKYNGKLLVQKIFFDKWFANYFKTYDGRYADRLAAAEKEDQEEAGRGKRTVKDEL